MLKWVSKLTEKKRNYLILIPLLFSVAFSEDFRIKYGVFPSTNYYEEHLVGGYKQSLYLQKNLNENFILGVQLTGSSYGLPLATDQRTVLYKGNQINLYTTYQKPLFWALEYTLTGGLGVEKLKGEKQAWSGMDGSLNLGDEEINTMVFKINTQIGFLIVLGESVNIEFIPLSFYSYIGVFEVSPTIQISVKVL